jgi:hypothetical protein
LLVPILFAFGCANRPNLIPEGYKELVKELPELVKIAARVDYPIVVNVEPTAKEFTVFWTKKGEVIWTEPFWNHLTWWRFGLIAQGEPEAICGTDWKRVESADLTEAKCEIDVKKYLSNTLFLMLDYRLGGDPETPPKEFEASGVVNRLYYLIEKK